MIKYKTVYDISVQLGTESIDYPDDPPYHRELISTFQENGVFDLSKLVMSAHSGTHIDTPAHFIPDGKHLDHFTAQNFILPARVLDISDKTSIKPSELKAAEIKPGEAFLFRTNNSTTGLCTAGTFSEKYVFLSPEAADFCIEKKVALVGIDYISIEEFGNETFPTHRKILGNNIIILEGINLKHVPPGKYTLICLPLKINGGEASPVRAVLLG